MECLKICIKLASLHAYSFSSFSLDGCCACVFCLICKGRKLDILAINVRFCFFFEDRDSLYS